MSLWEWIPTCWWYLVVNIFSTICIVRSNLDNYRNFKELYVEQDLILKFGLKNGPLKLSCWVFKHINSWLPCNPRGVLEHQTVYPQNDMLFAIIVIWKPPFLKVDKRLINSKERSLMINDILLYILYSLHIFVNVLHSSEYYYFLLLLLHFKWGIL